jgi:hypothetical protein
MTTLMPKFWAESKVQLFRNDAVNKMSSQEMDRHFDRRMGPYFEEEMTWKSLLTILGWIFFGVLSIVANMAKLIGY